MKKTKTRKAKSNSSSRTVRLKIDSSEIERLLADVAEAARMRSYTAREVAKEVVHDYLEQRYVLLLNQHKGEQGILCARLLERVQRLENLAAGRSEEFGLGPERGGVMALKKTTDG